jgi:hypothetical protein
MIVVRTSFLTIEIQTFSKYFDKFVLILSKKSRKRLSHKNHIKPKNMKTHLVIFSMFFLVFLGNPLFAQQEEEQPPIYRIETVDGNSFTGIILSETDDSILLRTEALGELTILKRNIVKRTIVDRSAGKFKEKNLHSNRYYLLNNSLGIPKGSGYYHNAWIFLNQAHYGITNNVSIGAGLIPLFLFGGATTNTPVWIVPSVTFPVSKDKVSLGANMIILTVTGTDAGVGGFLTFSGTLGNRNNNLNIGLGYGFYEDNWAETPLITISGMLRTGERHYLMTENFYVAAAGDFVMISFFGGRFDFRGLSLDYGLIIPIVEGMETIRPWPWLGLAIPFGKR